MFLDNTSTIKTILRHILILEAKIDVLGFFGGLLPFVLRASLLVQIVSSQLLRDNWGLGGLASDGRRWSLWRDRRCFEVFFCSRWQLQSLSVMAQITCLSFVMEVAMT